MNSDVPATNQGSKSENKANAGMVNVTTCCGYGAEDLQLDALPVFDIHTITKDLDTNKNMATSMAACLRDTSCLVIRDSRVATEDNEDFLDLMEKYFDQPDSEKLSDARPLVHYQVGVTPEGTEIPRCTVDTVLAASMKERPSEHQPLMPTGPDPKWRFFWRVGERPVYTEFAELNANPVIPHGFPQWPQVMNGWGQKMLNSLNTTAELIALGLGLPKDALTSKMHLGPHLLGPTGIDLGRHEESKRSFAGFHYDLNLLTIHGKSRFPGLFIWLADGRKIPVRIPTGCLLLQAGKQLEWLTAGVIKAGMHEVICSSETRSAINRAKATGRSLWRVSSTVFGHVASDQVLQPLGHFNKLPSAVNYPPIKAGAYVEKELSIIALKVPQNLGS